MAHNAVTSDKIEGANPKSILTKEEKEAVEKFTRYVKPYKIQPLDEYMMAVREKGVDYASMQQAETMRLVTPSWKWHLLPTPESLYSGA